MWWVLGGLVAVLVIGAIALQIAISRNGPAVLDTVDRIAGGARDAELKATIPTGDHPQQKVIVWGPDDRETTDIARPVLVFAHGGSWRSGDPVDYGFIGRAFVPKGFIVVLAGYRLGPDGAYPAMLEDTAAAIGWTRREIAQYGGDPDRIVIAGHSAGAYNVAMAALEDRWLAREGVRPGDIAGVVGLSGPYDFYPFDSDSTIAAFGHVTDGESTQPINHTRGPAPQMLLIHGEEDTLVYPRNTRILSEQLKAADNHALPVFLPDADHNRPLIALAAPWRDNSELVETIAGFAIAASATSTLSVPVQDETR